MKHPRTRLIESASPCPLVLQLQNLRVLAPPSLEQPYDVFEVLVPHLGDPEHAPVAGPPPPPRLAEQALDLRRKLFDGHLFLAFFTAGTSGNCLNTSPLASWASFSGVAPRANSFSFACVSWRA